MVLVACMRIGELAKRTGTSRDTIRFYEKAGLIQSDAEAGASNTYRDYSEETVFTLDLIRDAQAAGMSLSDLTVFFHQILAADDDFDGDDFLAEKIAEVETRIRRSRMFLKTLKDTRTALRRAPG